MWYNQHYTGREIMSNKTETKPDGHILTATMDHKRRTQHTNPPNWQTVHAWMEEGHSVKVTFEKLPKEETKKEEASE